MRCEGHLSVIMAWGGGGGRFLGGEGGALIGAWVLLGGNVICRNVSIIAGQFFYNIYIPFLSHSSLFHPLLCLLPCNQIVKKKLFLHLLLRFYVLFTHRTNPLRNVYWKRLWIFWFFIIGCPRSHEVCLERPVPSQYCQLFISLWRHQLTVFVSPFSCRKICA